MNRPNPMIELCALMARGGLTFAAFGEWSARHYGPVMGTAQVSILFEDFDQCLATLSSTELSRSLSRLLPVLVRLATTAPQSDKTGETYRLAELRSAMASPVEDANRVLRGWISRHHGEPRSIDLSRLRAIVSDLDAVLMTPGIEESELTGAVMRVRSVLARRAGLAPSVTITLAAEAEPAVSAPKIATPKRSPPSPRPNDTFASA